MPYFGYARELADGTRATSQAAHLREAGFNTVILEDCVGSGTPRFDELNASLRRRDTLGVWRLACLGRSTLAMLDLIAELLQRGIGIRSVDDRVELNPSGCAGASLVHALVAARSERRSERSEEHTSELQSQSN